MKRGELGYIDRLQQFTSFSAFIKHLPYPLDVLAQCVAVQLFEGR